MPVTRRAFLGTTVAGTGAWLASGRAAAAPPVERVPRAYFGLHPFIEANPKAVFIRRTRVPHKMDEAAKLKEGLSLGREIFVPMDRPGIPISHRIVLKPNQCSVHDRNRPDVENWGTGTDPQFYQGMVTALQEIGPKKFWFVEANNFHEWNVRGFVDINERLGIQMNEPERRARNFREDYEMTWSKPPDAVVYSRIPHYTPVNEPDTWLLNIAKWKAHGMCLSLTVKNEQGLVIVPFVRFCPGWEAVLKVPDWMKQHIHPQVEERVNRYFANHVKLGYTRYDSTADLSPIRQEIWAHKTCDNASVLKTGLAVIEGIYGRDGNGFGIGNDYLTNLVMFGKDKFRVDMIGMYLGGHEPGNIHLFRIAKERGLLDTFNPWEIPLYEWVDGAAKPVKLSEIERTPLKTYYLQKDGEPLYHLVNEPFDYARNKV
jgi:uncharacterized protein (DUF362 family)